MPSSFVRWMTLAVCFLLDAPYGHFLVLLSVVPSFLDLSLREDFSHNGLLLYHSAALDLWNWNVVCAHRVKLRLICSMATAEDVYSS